MSQHIKYIVSVTRIFLLTIIVYKILVNNNCYCYFTFKITMFSKYFTHSSSQYKCIAFPNKII